MNTSAVTWGATLGAFARALASCSAASGHSPGLLTSTTRVDGAVDPDARTACDANPGTPGANAAAEETPPPAREDSDPAPSPSPSSRGSIPAAAPPRDARPPRTTPPSTFAASIRAPRGSVAGRSGSPRGSAYAS